MEQPQKHCYDYPRPALTADCVIFAIDNGQPVVLLIQRKYDPFRGMWAFPGGFMDMDEDTDQCARRELLEETGIDDVFLEQLGAFSEVGRDPRGRTVTVAYWTMVDMARCRPVAGDDAQTVRWFPLSQIPPLAFDHAMILDAALERAASRCQSNRPVPVDWEWLQEAYAR